MICLQCGKAAEQTEVHDGIPIGTCEDGHRTGKALEGQYQAQAPEIMEGSWADIEKNVFNRKAS